MTRKRFLTSFVFMALLIYLFVRSLNLPSTYSFEGYTMGTTYHVTLAEAVLREDEVSDLKKNVESILSEINKSMSTWDPQSEISRFNASAGTEPFAVSSEFAQVVSEALDIADLTDGAFDPTVARLVALWGFGGNARINAEPDGAEIDSVLDTVGYKHLSVPGTGLIRKDEPAVTVDLSGVAKGYAVDRVADFLKGKGLTDLLVEVGGEIVVSGQRARGRNWRISIEVPVTSMTERGGHFRVMSVSDVGIATSGDYHNFHEKEGVTVSHLIDPRSGIPITNGVCSVTVLSETCMKADALATGLSIMGVEDGLKLVEDIAGTEALFIKRLADGGFESVMTSGFNAFLGSDR